MYPIQANILTSPKLQRQQLLAMKPIEGNIEAHTISATDDHELNSFFSTEKNSSEISHKEFLDISNRLSIELPIQPTTSTFPSELSKNTTSNSCLLITVKPKISYILLG